MKRKFMAVVLVISLLCGVAMASAPRRDDEVKSWM